MRILVTGAGGFVGRALVAGLVRDWPAPLAIVATDRAFPAPIRLPGVEEIATDLADPAAIGRLMEPGFDLVFHLASLPGAAAEQAPDAGRSINRDATFHLIDATIRSARGGTVPRFVLASSIAVYGRLGPGAASEDVPARPMLSYGAHKLVGEIELADRSRRGEILGASLRLPGIVARPLADSGHGSAFMSRIFHAAHDRTDYVCPAGRQARCWWMSVDCVVANLLHAARLDPALARSRQAWQLPVLSETVGAVIDALARRFGTDSVSRISFAPDERIEMLFGTMPDLSTPAADKAGFRHDGSLDALVARFAESRMAGR